MLLKHISRILLLGIFMIIISSKSEAKGGKLSWVSSQDSTIHVVDVNSGLHTRLDINHIDTLAVFSLDYPKGSLDVDRAGHVFWSKGSYWGVFDGFGIVLRIDTSARTIERHDRTIHSGYNFESYQFLRNDTLFSFGGYGFWMENNLLTFYSQLRREWNKYAEAPYHIKTPNKLSHRLAFYDAKHDVLYVTHEQKMYSYDFKTRLWEDEGFNNPVIEQIAVQMQHQLSDTTLLLMGNESAWRINFYANEGSDVTMANRVNVATYQRLRGLRCAYNVDDQALIIPRVSDILNSGLVLEFAPLPMPSVSRAVRLTTCFSGIQIAWALGILFGVLLVVGFFFVRRFYIKRQSGGLSVFAPRQSDVLEALLQGKLTTEALNNLLGLDAKSWEVQRRERSITVKELNQLGQELFSAELVLRQKALHDKRQVEYVLNEEVRSDLARLMH